MLLVLTALDDLAALSFVRASETAGTHCTVLTTEAMSFARRRSHRLSDDGVVTRLEMADGTVVSSSNVTGVVNRMLSPPDLAWRHATRQERDYASAELHAFTVSWLNALSCPVRNRPSPECLAGPVPHPFVAAAAAASAGLACPTVRMGTGHEREPARALLLAAASAAGAGSHMRQVVCLDGVVVADDAPPDVRSGVARLAGSLGLDEALVGLDFVVAEDTWWFAGTTPLPELRLGGRDLVGRLLTLLHPDPVAPSP